MKTIIKLIQLTLLITSFSPAIYAQSFLDRDFSRTEFTQMNCTPIEVYYDLSVSGNATNIILEDNFNTSGCNVGLTISPDASTMPVGYIFTQPSGPNSFRLELPNLGGQSGTVRLTMKLSYDKCLAAKYKKVSLCSSGPTVNNGIVINPILNSCITITNTNKWRTRLGCASLNGFNCYNYDVTINVPFTSRCGAYNLSGASIQEITFPIGTTDIVASGPLVIGQSVTGNVLRVTLNPASGVWNICNSYSFQLSAEYPCNLSQFADNANITISMTPSINGFGNIPLVFSPTSPLDCPLPQFNPISPDDIPGFTSSHTIRYPRAQAAVIFSRQAQASTHDAPGCENQLKVGLRNTGTTALKNIKYELSPIPAQMEVNCISGAQVSQIQTGGSSVWTNFTSTNLPANVSGIRWNVGTRVPTPPQCGTNPSTAGAWSTICYRIRNSAPLGSVITPCVTARFKNDIFQCEANNCNISLPTPQPIQACNPITVKSNAPYPVLRKSVIGNSSLFPLDIITFEIEVNNLGGSNLNTSLQDILNPNLELSNGVFNTSITYQYWDDAIGSWQNGHNGWITSNSIAGNTLDFGVNIPGQCQQRNGCCKRWTNNKVRIRFTARVVECSQRGLYTNTARLASPSTSARTTYSIRNRNRLNAYKENKGDVTPAFGSYTTVSPGGNLDYRIVIYNNDPKIWYNPVVVDVLPHIGDVELCAGTARYSQFNTTLRAPVTVNTTDATNIISVTQEYGSWGVLADADICATGSYPAWLSSYSNVPNSNGAFKIKFNGELHCGDSIVINIPAKVDPAALDGQLDTNKAYINQMTSTNGGYGNTPFAVTSVAQIEDWNPPCCDKSFVVRYGGSKIIQNGSINLAALEFDLQTFNNIPIQKVRASIVNFAYDTEYEDCMRCANPSKNLGTLDYNTRATFGGLNRAHFTENREMTWDLRNNGVPTLFSGGIGSKLIVRLPSQMNIPCCGGCVQLCIKFELTDVNCNTCEVIRCVTVELPKPDVRSKGACPRTPSDYDKPRFNPRPVKPRFEKEERINMNDSIRNIK